MTITLTPDIEDALNEKAREQGATPEFMALDALRERFVAPANGPEPKTANGAKTLWDLLAPHIGVLDSSELPARKSMLEFLDTLPQTKETPRAFASWEEYEAHLERERDSWDQ